MKLKRFLYFRDRLKGKILIISTGLIIFTFIGVSSFFNYSIEHLVMMEVEKEMEEEIGLLTETLKRGTQDVDRQLSEMSKLFSIVVIEPPRGVIYMTTSDFPKTWGVLRGYFGDNFGTYELKGIPKERIDEVIEENRYYSYSTKHMLMIPLPKNDFFPVGSYLGLTKDISYLKNIKYTINLMLLVVLCLLTGVQILLVNYAMDKVLGALRELNEFTGGLYKEEVFDLSQRFTKRYGSREVDKLIVTLNKLIENVEINIEKMEEFSSNVSHELKTPIASMKSMIEIELVQERSAKDYEETLLKILEEINWLDGMIKELLNLTQNPQSLKRLFKPVDLAHMGNDICDIMEMIAMESGIDLSWNFDDIKDIRVIGDAGSLKQVIMNLINNSIKYNRENGWIRVRGETFENTVKIVVEDCGIGIKKENIARITDRFFREDNVRTHKKSGVGLGLAIVKHILEVHKGYLEISSELGKGSTFKICLPIDREEEKKRS